jgi:hypothetical protein
MRSRQALVSVRDGAVRKARMGLIVVVAAGVAVSFWIRFFRGLSRSGEQQP